MKLPGLQEIPNRVNQNHWRFFIVLLVTGVLFMTTWASFKSGVTFHIDELWQYSFSNSNGRLTNAIERPDYDKWLPGTAYRDYLTVQPGERFAYGPITRAASRDVHPPLSYYLLHTASSFFPNQFSKWLGLGLNIGIYATTLLVLYLLAGTLFATRYRALVASALWAFSLGAINTVLYIRMYCLLTLCAVTLALFAVKYLRGHGTRYLVMACGVFVVGGLTDYLFWLFGFFTTLGFVMVTLRRNPRKAFAFAAAALSGFLTVCALFPATYQQFTRKDSLSNWAIQEFSVMDRLQQFFHVKQVLRRLIDNTGDSSFLLPSGGVITLLALAAIALVCGLAGFAIISFASVAVARLPVQADSAEHRDARRNSDLLLSHWRSLIADSARLFRRNVARLLRRAGQWLSTQPTPVFLTIAVACTAYTLAAVFPDFEVWTLRAFFFVYPFLSLLVAAVLFQLHQRLHVPAIIIAIIVLILLFRTTVLVRSPFTFRDGYAALATDVRDRDVIVLLDSADSMMRLTNFSVPLTGASHVLVTIIENENYRQQLQQAIRTVPSGSDIVIINTIGRPPHNHPAGEILGWDFLLTEDKPLMHQLQKGGWHLKLEQKGAYLFQTFNLYRLSRN